MRREERGLRDLEEKIETLVKGKYVAYPERKETYACNVLRKPKVESKD